MKYVSVAGPGKRIHFRLGDNEYDRTSQSGLRFLYVSYGAFAMNILRQHFRIVDHTNVWYIELINNTNNLVIEGNALNAAARQPTYIDEVFSIHPGTITTYDWATGCFPVIYADDLPPTIFGALARNPHVTLSPYSLLSRFNHTLNAIQGPAAFDAIWRSRESGAAHNRAIQDEAAALQEN